jgi:hydroxyacylglutathione hydrolase
MKTEQVHPKVWKFTGSDSVNSYFLDMDKRIFIDCGNSHDAEQFKKAVMDVVNPANVDLVLFTHLHYDHAGNFSLFKNAKFYASAEEIADFKKCAPFYPDKGLMAKLKPLPEELFGLKVIPVPGHTRGSVCFWLEKQMILFTGDTYFRKGVYGRTDLANSEPEKIKESIARIRKLPVKLVCPGHDY